MEVGAYIPSRARAPRAPACPRRTPLHRPACVACTRGVGFGGRGISGEGRDPGAGPILARKLPFSRESCRLRVPAFISLVCPRRRRGGRRRRLVRRAMRPSHRLTSDGRDTACLPTSCYDRPVDLRDRDSSASAWSRAGASLTIDSSVLEPRDRGSDEDPDHGEDALTDCTPTPRGRARISDPRRRAGSRPGLDRRGRDEEGRERPRARARARART